MEDLESKYPQTLIIYLKTNIPNYGYITYLPKMSNVDESGDVVFFTSQVNLNKECFKKEDKPTNSDVFFNKSKFSNLIRSCGEKNEMKSADFNKSLFFYTNAGNVSNNIQFILDTIFKKNNVIYLDSKSYNIHSTVFSPQAWQMDTKPLYMIPNNLIKEADKDFERIKIECPDCIAGPQSVGIIKTPTQKKESESESESDKIKKYSNKLLNLEIKESLKVCDIRSFFYLVDSQMGFPETIVNKYIESFQKLIAIQTSPDIGDDIHNYNKLIITQYKNVFKYILEILNIFIEKAEQSNSPHDDLMDTFIKCCKLDISIYTALVDMEFKEILARLFGLPSTISSITQSNLDFSSRDKILLAIQSFFAFYKCKETNKELMNINAETKTYDYMLKIKLTTEYCRILNNVYYFQQKFIHVYLHPVIDEFQEEKKKECGNESLPTSQCFQNTNSSKITTLFSYLFIQSARKYYLKDFCEENHHKKTLDKKCEKILKLFTGPVLNDKTETKIKDLFNFIKFNGYIESKHIEIKSYIFTLTDSTLKNALQVLIKLNARLNCEKPQKIKKEFQEKVEEMAKNNNLNILILNSQNVNEILNKLKNNNKSEYFVLTKYGENKYNIVINTNRVLFEIKEDEEPEQEQEQEQEQDEEQPTMGGATIRGEKNTKYYNESDRNRIREKASLDTQKNIYKPTLLAYYIEVSLELFPSNLTDDTANKNSFMCNSRRLEIKQAMTSIKRDFQSAVSSMSSSPPSNNIILSSIPSFKQSQNAQAQENVSVVVNAPTDIHQNINKIHESMININNSIHDSINNIKIDL